MAALPAMMQIHPMVAQRTAVANCANDLPSHAPVVAPYDIAVSLSLSYSPSLSPSDCSFGQLLLLFIFPCRPHLQQVSQWRSNGTVR